jgi:hypothetical protein
VGYAAVGGFSGNTPKTKGHVFQLTCTALCAKRTWANKSGNLPDIPANAIAVNPNAPKQVFVGTDWGLYYTDDITKKKPVWLHFQNGLPNTMIWSFSVDRGATTLAVFTRSRGTWAIPLPTESATQQTQFTDDFESEKGWTVTAANTCTWNKDTSGSDSASGTNEWTTHPYGDSCSTNLTSPAIAIPSGANTIRLSFNEKHDSESGDNGGSGCPCDFGIVQLSTDGGANFTSVGPQYDGTQPVYSKSTIPLPDSAAGKSIRIRFHFQSDGTVSDPAHSGWYVDDVAVSLEPH